MKCVGKTGKHRWEEVFTYYNPLTDRSHQTRWCKRCGSLTEVVKESKDGPWRRVEFYNVKTDKIEYYIRVPTIRKECFFDPTGE